MYTRGLGTPTASQHSMFYSENLSHFFLMCSWCRRGWNLRSLDLESDALPTEPPRHPYFNYMSIMAIQIRYRYRHRYWLHVTNVCGRQEPMENAWHDCAYYLQYRQNRKRYQVGMHNNIHTSCTQMANNRHERKMYQMAMYSHNTHWRMYMCNNE